MVQVVVLASIILDFGAFTVDKGFFFKSFAFSVKILYLNFTLYLSLHRLNIQTNCGSFR